MKRNTLILIIGLIAIGVGGRLIPHLPNFTPIAALAFVGSQYFGRKAALILPLVALFLGDMLIGFYSFGIMASVYGSFLIIAIMSWWTKKHSNIFAVGYTVIIASVVFFLITNAAVWWFSPWYTKNLAGLMYSYELGLPFLRNMLLGDIVYTFTLLGVFAVFPSLMHSGKKMLTDKVTIHT